jgi:hypothetical protein
MHRAVKKYGSQVLLNSSRKFGISSEFYDFFFKKAIRLIYRNGGSTGMKERISLFFKTYV